MVREAIAAVVSGKNLTEEEASQVMAEIMSGECTPSQISAFLVAMRMKGETVDELTGFARVMREKALKVSCQTPAQLIDTCGTGGDGSNTFNVSTAAAFAAAAAGAKVAKHGNRSASSRCGSADVLEALGIELNLTPEQVAKSIDEIGIGFMFAPLFHPAMKHAAPVRREIGIRTMFNLLGPLVNPAGVTRQVIGVPREDLVPKIAETLLRLGSEHAMVAFGEPGLDELSTVGPSTIAEVKNGRISIRKLDPTALNLRRASLSDLNGADAQHNAKLLSEILSGTHTSPATDTVALNAAAALVVGGVAEDLRHGTELAFEALRTGAAADKLDALRKASRKP
ncbi:MAG: anthranilate phosphoribosyltransferase [Armatimonadota bacterium]